jgi:Skp family chaperone for outer membrane proteins
MQKKIALALVIFGVGSLSCDSGKIYSIDGDRVFHESREGRNILAKIGKESDSLMKLKQTETQKLVNKRNDIEEKMRTGKISEEELQDESNKFDRMQRSVKQKIDDAELDVRASSDKLRTKFAKKFNTIAVEFFKKDGCSMVLDKKTPGVIYVADSIDKTDDLIKELNSRETKAAASSSLKKGSKIA